MSRIQIYYFSGTGNTKFIVNKIAKKLSILGNEVNINSCEENKEINYDYDVLGIVTSAYIAGDVLAFEGKKHNHSFANGVLFI